MYILKMLMMDRNTSILSATEVVSAWFYKSGNSFHWWHTYTSLYLYNTTELKQTCSGFRFITT